MWAIIQKYCKILSPECNKEVVSDSRDRFVPQKSSGV